MGTNKMLLCVIIVFIVQVGESEGCHRKRKKRSYSYVPLPPTVVRFFPGCMRRQLYAVPHYGKRAWNGAVSFALFHSQWYLEADSLCGNEFDHTVDCWINLLTNFISKDSPALLAAQRCVKAYNGNFERRLYSKPEYPNGTAKSDNSACPAVKPNAYRKKFTKRVNKKGIADEDSSISRLDDVIEFARNDMICPNCSCSSLKTSKKDNNEYIIPGGETCGQCWVTRLATDVREGSRFKFTAGQLAVRLTALRKKPKPPPKTVYYLPPYGFQMQH